MRKLPLRVSHNDFVSRVESRCKVRVIGIYKGLRTPVKVKSKVCGHAYQAKVSDLLWKADTEKASTCPSCRSTRLKYPRDWFERELAAAKPHIHLVGNYTGFSYSAQFKCAKCTTAFTGIPFRVLQLKFGCMTCSQNHTGYARTAVKRLGVTFKLQGYEPVALDLLIAKGLHPKAIKTGFDVPVFGYHDRGKDRRYRPDFYLPSLNRLIEVKSTYTMLGKREWFVTLKAKRASVLDAGFHFTLVVFNKRKQKVKLPDAWYILPYNKLRKIIQVGGL